MRLTSRWPGRATLSQSRRCCAACCRGIQYGDANCIIADANAIARCLDFEAPDALIFALVEDGLWDALSCVTLSIPIALLVVCIVRGRA
jgi:hypothetical protein